MVANATKGFRAYGSSCSDAVCISGPDKRILATNQAFTARLGNLVGATFAEHAAKAHRSNVWTKVDALFEGETTASIVHDSPQ